MVVNCGGPFSDGVRRLDEPSTTSWIAASQGAHVVLPKAFLPEESAVIVPRTPDGRVVFAIPWRGRALVGTTDVPLDRTPDEPTATAEEVDYLLETIAPYLRPAPTRADILSTFAGVRPLVQADPDAKTSKLSRDHQLRVSDSGLLSVLGGKWTTYRRMAQDAVDSAAQLGGLNVRPCKTAHLAIPDYAANEAHPVVAPLHPRLPATESHVRRAIRWELARTVEDVLSRRTRCLLLDAHAAIEAAPRVAELLAEALGRDPAWQTGQVTAFTTLARQHTVRP